jgi:hypothetical protein
MPVGDFKRQMAIEFKKAVDETEFKALKALVTHTFDNLFQVWPGYTYWSMANIRVSMTGRDINLVRPLERPEDEYALIDEAFEQRVGELAKLESLEFPVKKGRTIVIGNAVPYASDVGFQPGNGQALFIEAAREAEHTVQMLIKRNAL